MGVNDDIRKVIDDSDFDAWGVTSFELMDSDVERLRSWLVAGFHGDMHYMERSVDVRRDMRMVFEDVKGVVVTLTAIRRVEAHVPTIASFAHNYSDYHDVTKDRLRGLLRQIQVIDPSVQGRAVVDSAPVFEKSLALRAGLGWIGRNSLLINPRLGSYTIIGVLLLNRDLSNDEPVHLIADGCPEGCTACRRACPTGAILENRMIDARRCISYITMEQSGPVNEDTCGSILGCDRCLDACPYNRSVETMKPKFEGEDWLAMTDAEFRAKYKRTSVGRVGLDRIKSIISSEQYAARLPRK